MIARATLSLALLCVAQTAVAACPKARDGVVDIFPTAEVLPENLLRVYVYFPRPMAADEGLKNVRLLDRDGAAIAGVFLANREDLWSPDRRRLTLILDPGRVKTGLVAHEALGRALLPGRAYTLEVSGAALDAERCALGADRRHGFTAGPADTEAPDPARWSLEAPKAASTDPLVVELGSAHDHLSLAFRLRVHDAEGTIVPGAIALGEGETSWRFTPRDAWGRGSYRLVVDGRLEDLAGNRPGALFDRPAEEDPAPWTRHLEFTPRS